MYLEGPFALRVLKSQSDRKTIVLLGERHFTLANAATRVYCPRDGVTPVLSIADYLDVLFSSASQEKFDLFMEITPVMSRYGILFADALLVDVQAVHRAPLPGLQLHYLQCLRRMRSCEFPNVRFHWSDERREMEFHNAFIDYLTGAKDATATALELWSMHPSEYKSYILEEDFIEKQLQKTRPDVAEVIKQDIDVLARSANEKLDLFRKDHAASKEYVDAMWKMWISIVDYYLLARIFKPETSDNIIVYVGDAHRQNLERLLRFELHFLRTDLIDSDGDTCIKIDSSYNGFFFAPLAAHPPSTPGKVELINLLMRPSFSFETSWYASQYNIIRLMAIYFRRETSVLTAYSRMKAETGTSFTFQRVKDTVALFVHNTKGPKAEPDIANTLLLPTREKIKLKDDSVRGLFIYKDAYARLSPLAQIILTLLISQTPEPPTSNLLVLLQLKES